jgi:tetratricopeptide (TPR) repeat protein
MHRRPNAGGLVRWVQVSGILVSAFSLAPQTTMAQPRGRGDMAAANALYVAQRYAEAAAAYQAVVAADPSSGEAHFFLANALDNQYRPSRRGEPDNDRLLEAARDHYATAADLLVGSDKTVVLKRTLQYLAAIYASDKLNKPEQAALVARRLIALDPDELGGYFGLATIYEDAGRLDEAEAVLEQLQLSAPDRIDVWAASAQFYNRTGDFDRTMKMFRRITEIEPDNPQSFYQMAVYFEEKVRKDFTLDRTRQTAYVAKGLDAVDRALALRPDYFEALTYKNLLLRQQARFEADPDIQRQLLEQADALRRQALAVREAQAGTSRRP